jgi:hypothetical protein
MLAALLLVGSVAASCVGHDGERVDWWLIVKYPAGLSAAYMDSASADYTNLASINEAGPLGGTLGALKQTGAGWVIYNDKEPNGTEHWTFAHAKGVLGLVSQPDPSFFFITHSLPAWPLRDPRERGFSDVQHPQTMFGQHLFCVSLAGAAGAEAVASQLLVSRPYVYSSRLPAGPQLVPSAHLLANRSFCTNCTCSWAGLSSSQGMQLTLFSKSPSFRWAAGGAVAAS